MDFSDLIKGDFEIRDGRFYGRCGEYTDFSLDKRPWSENDYVVMGDYSGNLYHIEPNYYGHWCLFAGYSEVLQLVHLGGLNWKKY